MCQWPSSKTRKVYKALLKIGWTEHYPSREAHTNISSVPDTPDFNWAFHDSDAIGSRMLARIAKRTGLRPEDL
jgi:predicted RNA binding protein YcfA (HicA-like mRNA interferase family)